MKDSIIEGVDGVVTRKTLDPEEEGSEKRDLATENECIVEDLLELAADDQELTPHDATGATCGSS